MACNHDRALHFSTGVHTFDEQLNHYASQRFCLDLDDGVKVNYAKFGTLLADVKKVSGSKSDD